MLHPPALYIHIPFCRSKCHYCDFNSYAGKSYLVPSYVQAVIKEIERLPANELYSVCVGGGTPTIMEVHCFEALFSGIYKKFHLSSNAEITVEANPESLTREKLKTLRREGVNRLSVGLQSTHAVYLELLGRVHTLSQFESVYGMAREEGFDNINIDLIFGIPGLSMDEWQQTLTKITGYKPEHISLYALSVEEGTQFHKNNISPDDDRAGDQYEYAVAYLAENGFNRYEISNFARPGRKSRHNSMYWEGREYYGVGAGASSYIKNKRTKNISDIGAYIDTILSGRHVFEEEEIIDEQKRIREKLLLGLRKSVGVICGNEEDGIIKNKLDCFLKEGLLQYNPPVLKLSDRGILLANQIWRELV